MRAGPTRGTRRLPASGGRCSCRRNRQPSVATGYFPSSTISAYRRTENQLRHFDDLPGWPDGFIVLGDAACCFNPVYGQGMTVAAIEALVLQAWLRNGAPA